MARPHPHPDHERERFPVAWEDDDTPGLSIHALTREDTEAILASMPDEPDDEPPLRLPSLRKAAAARRRERRSYGTPGGTAQAEYQRRRQAEHAACAHAPGPCGWPRPCWPGLVGCWWRAWPACPCPPTWRSPS
jgi:hypothetical protein